VTERRLTGDDFIGDLHAQVSDRRDIAGPGASDGEFGHGAILRTEP
jgi:hypothetical protein